MLERSLRPSVLVPLLTTFGLAIFIENGLFEYLGADTRSLAPYIGDFALTVSGSAPTFMSARLPR